MQSKASSPKADLLSVGCSCHRQGELAAASAHMIQRLRALLPKGRLARGVTLLVTGTALGQVLVIAASPLLTRLYAPVDFGALAVFSAFLGILVAIGSLRYELAIPLAEDDERVVNLLVVTLIVGVVTSALTGVVVWQWGQAIVRSFNAELLEPLIWLLPVGLLVAGCSRGLLHWAIRRQDFGRISRTQISRSVGRVVTQVCLGVATTGPLGLLLGQIIGHSAGITTLGLAFHRRDGGLCAASAWAASHAPPPATRSWHYTPQARLCSPMPADLRRHCSLPRSTARRSRAGSLSRRKSWRRPGWSALPWRACISARRRVGRATTAPACMRCSRQRAGGSSPSESCRSGWSSLRGHSCSTWYSAPPGLRPAVSRSSWP